MRRPDDILASPRVVPILSLPGEGIAFLFRPPAMRILQVIVTWSDGWEHASATLRVSREDVPTWNEMSALHRLVWGEQEAMQLHVSTSDHVNCHPGCLHLWRPIGQQIPLPDPRLVGPKAVTS